MAKIIWAGNKFFGPCMQDLGHELFYVDYSPGRILFWEDMLRLSGCPSPDFFVLGDLSSPPFVLGVESFPCPTFFYCVDSHIHSWYPRYAQAFDFCLVSLKDKLPLFGAANGMRLPKDRIIWCPPFEIRKITAIEQASAPDKQWDVLFVGKADNNVNPERVLFLQNLKALVPSLHWQGGNFRTLFPKARLVLNHCIAGDLNFRVMEALACGSCLLTPKVENGLEELFTPGEDLFTFDQQNLPELEKLVKRLLRDPDLCARVSASGLNKVNMKHLGGHRALLLGDALQRLVQGDQIDSLVRERLENQKNIREEYLKFIYLLLAESIEMPALRMAYLKAAKQ